MTKQKSIFNPLTVYPQREMNREKFGVKQTIFDLF